MQELNVVNFDLHNESSMPFPDLIKVTEYKMKILTLRWELKQHMEGVGSETITHTQKEEDKTNS